MGEHQRFKGSLPFHIATAETMHDRLARIEAFIHADGLDFKRRRFQRSKENKTLRAELHFLRAAFTKMTRRNFKPTCKHL